ncbi:hypothetical protein F4861DRAFT_124480 [Xylaria intraflava]|nr:hypothetical protein F4861DRAFT_124480 [Xylaria intraflava]
MSSGVRFTPTIPKSGKIYLAVSWRDFEDRNTVDTSIIATTRPPDGAVKPEGGLEYYHEWKAVNASENQGPADWELHTESGWLGFKSRLALILELGPVEHADPYSVLDTAVWGALDHEQDEPSHRSFIERVLESIVALADDPETRVSISDASKLTLREQAGEVVSFAEILSRNIHVSNEGEVTPDWVRTLLVFGLDSE